MTNLVQFCTRSVTNLLTAFAFGPRTNPASAPLDHLPRLIAKWKIPKTKLRTCCIVVLFCGAPVIASPAQSIAFTTLASFDGSDGSDPYLMSLVPGADGNFYGTTLTGGANCSDYGGCGTVFKITPSGTLTALYSFCSQPNCTDGNSPYAGLVLATDGNFYGTTSGLGNGGLGTVFRITPAGTLTTLHNFDVTDGSYPYAALVQATDGNFYGTTNQGGANGYGTVFKITPSGTLTTLYSFCSQLNCTDGSLPYAGLVQATDGNFYGTTSAGGDLISGGGTVFKITAAGELTTLHSFCVQESCSDGADPHASLVQGTDGNFYGTTISGGIDGTVFTITPAGTLVTLYRFGSPNDGATPYAGLVQGTDGNFYGTTVYGGANGNYGTIYRIAAAGAHVFTTLHSFDSTDGANPVGGLVQADGFFYGTTQQGGAYDNCPNGCGTVFRLACSKCVP